MAVEREHSVEPELPQPGVELLAAELGQGVPQVGEFDEVGRTVAAVELVKCLEEGGSEVAVPARGVPAARSTGVEIIRPPSHDRGRRAGLQILHQEQYRVAFHQEPGDVQGQTAMSDSPLNRFVESTLHLDDESLLQVRRAEPGRLDRLSLGLACGRPQCEPQECR